MSKKRFLVVPVMLLFMFSIDLSGATTHIQLVVGENPPQKSAIRKRSKLTERQLDLIGQYLARWGNAYKRAIFINDLPVNLIGPNGGGPSPVIWQHDLSDMPDKEGKAHLRRENTAVRQNLKKVISGSGCEISKLTRYLKQIDDDQNFRNISLQQLSEACSCLGDFRFQPTPWLPK